MASALLRVTRQGIVTHGNDEEITKGEEYKIGDGLTFIVNTVNLELDIYNQLHVAVYLDGQGLYWRLLDLLDKWEAGWYLLTKSGAARLDRPEDEHVKTAHLVAEAVAGRVAQQEWPVSMIIIMCQDMSRIFFKHNEQRRLVTDGEALNHDRDRGIYPEATYVIKPHWHQGFLTDLTVYVAPNCDEGALQNVIASLK